MPYTRREILQNFLYIPGLALPRLRLLEPSPLEIDVQILDTDLTPQFSDFLKNLILFPPDIGGISNYKKSLDTGLGYATYHSIPYVALKNNMRWYDISTLEEASKGSEDDIIARCEADLSGLSVIQALLSHNLYTGTMAVRSPKDLGKVYAAFKISAPDTNPALQVKFIGPVLTVDVASKKDWNNNLAFQRYKHMGWQNQPWNGLQWIADASSSLMQSLYPGKSGNPDNLSEGKAILLVSKQKALKLMGYTTSGYRFR